MALIDTIMVWIFLLAVLGSVACKPPRPCIRSHVVHHASIPDTFAYWPATDPGLGITPYGVGFHIGGGMHLVPGSPAWDETVCDERAK